MSSIINTPLEQFQNDIELFTHSIKINPKIKDNRLRLKALNKHLTMAQNTQTKINQFKNNDNVPDLKIKIDKLVELLKFHISVPSIQLYR